jgi:RNA polymerase sigma-70 factor (ECF subfamily)
VVVVVDAGRIAELDEETKNAIEDRRPDRELSVSTARRSARSPIASKSPIKRRTSRAATRAAERDEELIDRIRQGDREAFNELYDRYFKRIYGFLDKRLRNRADTEETTQEVFINVFSSIDSFRGEAPFAAWIFGLTRRTLAARFKRKRHPTIPLADDDEERLGGAISTSTSPCESADPLANYEMSERAEHLLHALEHELSPDQRQVFEMHHLQSLPIVEIARELSKSEDSIKSSLYRTRKLLLAR